MRITMGLSAKFALLPMLLVLSFALPEATSAQTCLASPGPTVVRVNVKKVIGPNGASPWVDSDITAMVTGASTILQGWAGISLQLEPIETLLDPGYPKSGPHTSFTAPQPFYSSWFNVNVADIPAMEQAAKADPCTFKFVPDAINLYLVDSFCNNIGGQSAYPDPQASGLGWNELILLTPGFFADRALGLVHELAHYFDVYHPFDQSLGTEVPANCQNPSTANCMNIGDGVCDTAPVTSSALDALECLYNAAAGTCSQNPAGWPSNCINNNAYDSVRFNLMSYYSGIDSSNAFLTPGQINRMRAGLEQFRCHVVNGPQAPPTPVLSSVVPVPAQAGTAYPGPTSIALNGAFLPTSNVNVRLGRVSCSPTTTTCTFPQSPAVCESLVPAVPATGTANSLNATFGSPLPPGSHCVTLEQNGRLVAYLEDALEITPYVQVEVLDPLTQQIRVRLKSSTPNRPVLLAVGTPSNTALAVPPTLYSLFLSYTGPADPWLLPVSATDGQGLLELTELLTILPPGLFFGLQAAELAIAGDPQARFSNVVPVVVPE